MSVRPIPRLEGIAGPLKKITLHGDAVVCIHIVLQPGVVIREILSKRDKERKRWKGSEKVGNKRGKNKGKRREKTDRKQKIAALK